MLQRYKKFIDLYKLSPELFRIKLLNYGNCIAYKQLTKILIDKNIKRKLSKFYEYMHQFLTWEMRGGSVLLQDPVGDSSFRFSLLPEV